MPEIMSFAQQKMFIDFPFPFSLKWIYSGYRFTCELILAKSWKLIYYFNVISLYKDR